MATTKLVRPEAATATETSPCVNTVKDVTCPFCGCLCDDIHVTVENNVITKAKNACGISAAKFRHAERLSRRAKATYRLGSSVKELTNEEALNKAAEILLESKRPLLFGFATTSVEVIRIGLELAEKLKGVADNTSSVCHGPGIIAQQIIGESTCTLGEVKNRADVIVYWGCNPVHAHPRHIRRYSAEAVGRFRPNGRKDRTVIVVDIRETPTAKKADYFLQITPNSDFEVVNTIRMLLRGRQPSRSKIGGVEIDKIKEIVDILKKAEMGVLFFGVGLTMSKGKMYNVQAVTQLTMDLNRYAKFNSIPMRGHFNVGGANKVFTWTTGYPLAVDFSRGFPRYSPTEYTGVQSLLRKDVDAMLVVASDPVAHFPRKAVEYMMQIPLITIDPYESLTASVSDLHIPSTIVGLEEEGTAYRMDSIPLPLKKIVDPPVGIQSDVAILNGILQRIKEGQ
ncbi:MAG: formylmethanofuran dehydrogenase subunit B [Candidatus Ranarchaeia archaeon]